ncbi:MAG: DNA-protecting protein DprA [Chlorobi bacterium]|nr:DNA-protecting protein DprA [Chlorobiota bacterium]
MEDDLRYKIGLALLPGVGPMTAKKLLTIAESPAAVFNHPLHVLNHAKGVKKQILTSEQRNTALKNAQKEIEFTEKNGIKPLFFLDTDYPNRLRQCDDAPIMLYQQGEFNLDPDKIISIVGTRNSTLYGEKICEKLISDLSGKYPDLVIVSGLAYGIDVCAHRAALKNNIKTVAILGHGLNLIYPAIHRKTAEQISQNGCLITEFGITQTPDKRNFVQRNRIIAGLSVATIVIESGIQGGALITADLANSYNRDVFTFPGRVGDPWSEGCHKLIKNNQAALIESAEDLEYMLGWTTEKKSPAIQKQIFVELSPDEETILTILKEHDELSIDHISIEANFPVSKTSSILLNLEFTGFIKSLPGNRYRYIP